MRGLDIVMRRIFGVCARRGIKLAPSKLQIGRKIRWGGVIVESIGPRGGRNDVLISPEEAKVAEFINIDMTRCFDSHGPKLGG